MKQWKRIVCMGLSCLLLGTAAAAAASTIGENEGVSVGSILPGGIDSLPGKDAAVNTVEPAGTGDLPPEEYTVVSGDVQLTEAGKVKAEGFIEHTSLIAFKDLNGSYALIDLNGNVLTESVYTQNFRGASGMVEIGRAHV